MTTTKTMSKSAGAGVIALLFITFHAIATFVMQKGGLSTLVADSGSRLGHPFSAIPHVAFDSHRNPNKTRLHDLPILGVTDLPGYTGWARPAKTDAPLYEIEHITPLPHVAHNILTIVVRCCSEQCLTLNWAQFYVRMYGPAILTGKVTAMGKGRYRVEFLPRHTGKYWVEVVLTFSRGADITQFPLSVNKTGVAIHDPAYEGYLLPGFPLPIQVTRNEADRRNKGRLCGADDLRVRSTDDGLRMATWKVVDKVNSHQHQREEKNSIISLSGYQNGQNSLGILADYQPTKCNLIQPYFARVIDMCVNSKNQGRLVHFVFIGDSVLRLQMDMMQTLAQSQTFKTTRVNTAGGIIQQSENVTATLRELNSTQEDFVILFNSGLHDINVFCNHRMDMIRPNFLPDPSKFNCVDEYREKLRDLANVISSMPARAKIFQTTSAAWMKWGNYGPAWNPGMAQTFATSTHAIEVFNKVALDVLDDLEGFDIVDGYWISLARPDNRQIDRLNNLPKHLVHPGIEVLQAMVRSWMTLVLSKLGCDLF